MLFELVIPARNEGAIIQDVLRRLTKSLDDLDIDWQITVAINGTTDDTLQRIDEYRMANSKYQELIKFIECPEAGKGAAVRYAAQNSSADVFGFIDADLSADPEMIAPMVKMLLDGKVDVVIGSRLTNVKTTNRNWLRTMSSRLFNSVAALLLGIKVKDAQCGLKIMNARARRLLAEGKEAGWFMDIEFLVKVVQDKLAIIEVPVPWIEYRYAGRKSQLSMLKDGMGSSLQAMLRIRRRMG
ncbi:MAG: glycosyltransferase family 2 protein [Patescibacteria group bacterium]|nr:glycosyltransferase family 2 protein [Patescibacteria group bacterium]